MVMDLDDFMGLLLPRETPSLPSASRPADHGEGRFGRVLYINLEKVNRSIKSLLMLFTGGNG